MRRTLLAAVGCFMALASLAQNNAEIIVSYNFKYPGISGKERTQKMSLWLRLPNPNTSTT